MINKLMTFEKKIMRKIYDSTRTEDGYWRIKINQEINDILKGQNIIGFITKQRLNWLGHVERMAEDNIVQRIKRTINSSSTKPSLHPYGPMASSYGAVHPSLT